MSAIFAYSTIGLVYIFIIQHEIENKFQACLIEGFAFLLSRQHCFLTTDTNKQRRYIDFAITITFRHTYALWYKAVKQIWYDMLDYKQSWLGGLFP